jgi:hypothetical protein
MTSKQQRPPQPPSKDDRLAKALRENLARRKALVRARKSQTGGEVALPVTDAADPAHPPRDDEPV